MTERQARLSVESSLTQLQERLDNYDVSNSAVLQRLESEKSMLMETIKTKERELEAMRADVGSKPLMDPKDARFPSQIRKEIEYYQNNLEKISSDLASMSVERDDLAAKLIDYEDMRRKFNASLEILGEKEELIDDLKQSLVDQRNNFQAIISELYAKR